MRNEHLTPEEIIAYSEKSYQLLSEAREHLTNCPECRESLGLYAMSKTALLSSGNIKHFVSPAHIEYVADMSFSYLGKPASEEKPYGGFFAFLFQPKIAFGTAFAACVLALMSLFYSINNSQPADPENTMAANDKNEILGASNKTEIETKTLTEKEAYIEAGTKISLKRADIITLRRSLIKKIDESNISIVSGHIGVSVEKGDDFFIHVNSSHLVRVLGTRFTVEAGDSECTVAVTEGLVEVINKNTKDSVALGRDMKKLFNYNNTLETPQNKKQEKLLGKIRKTIESTENTGIANIPEGGSYLKMGRESIKASDFDKAMSYFNMEMEKGTEKDKALFEIVRLFEKNGKYNEVLDKINKHTDIIDSGTAYQEEFYVKACKAESKFKTDAMPYCKKYLKLFPGGYKKEEIRKLLGEK